MEEKETYSVFDIRETDPYLEKHRRDVIEKYLEYEFVSLQKAKEQGKTLDDVIDEMKTILWYIKNERIQQIKNELGL